MGRDDGILLDGLRERRGRATPLHLVPTGRGSQQSKRCFLIIRLHDKRARVRMRTEKKKGWSLSLAETSLFGRYGSTRPDFQFGRTRAGACKRSARVKVCNTGKQHIRTPFLFFWGGGGHFPRHFGTTVRRRTLTLVTWGARVMCDVTRLCQIMCDVARLCQNLGGNGRNSNSKHALALADFSEREC